MNYHSFKTHILQTCFSKRDARHCHFLLNSKGALLAALVALASLLPGIARAQIYVLDEERGTIGEYGLDGSAISPSLISKFALSLVGSGDDLFAEGGGVVNEYNTSGGTVAAPLFSYPDNSFAMAISGGDLFVGGYDQGNIGEYTLGGTPINTTLFTQQELHGNVQALAVSGDDIYVGTVGGGVEEFTLEGTPINNPGFMGTSGTEALAISGNDLFAATSAGNVAEYTLNGNLVKANLVTGVNPQALTVSGGEIYVGNFNGTIGEYNLDGTPVNADLISGFGRITGIVVAVPEPSVTALGGLGMAGLFLIRRVKGKTYKNDGQL